MVMGVSLEGRMKFIPEEWTTSWTSLRAMGELTSGRGFSIRHSIWFLIIFAVGAIGGWMVGPAFVLSSSEGVLFALLAGIIALGGLISGFMVTLMLFSGRLENVDGYTLEELQDASLRLKLLLASQAQTLFAGVIGVVFAVVWLCFHALNFDLASQRIAAAFCFAFMLVSVVRFILVPLQIFEIHEAGLDGAVEAKRKAEVDRYAKKGG